MRRIEKQHILRIIKAVESLAENPFSSHSRKLKGAEDFYRIRVGDYRIIYQIEPSKKRVIVYYIRHRKITYRKF